MRYKVFNGPPREFYKGDPVPELKYNGQIVVAIDPSKTNCAVIIGDPGGEVLNIMEFSGNNWSQGPVDDTTEFCSELKDFLNRYLGDSEVFKIGLEKAITKRGMNHHVSSMVLTEIRGALLGLFYDKYGLQKEDVEVNNWSWKHAILPEGYRGQKEKGSVRYFWEYLKDPTYLSYYEDDVTDALCIYKYLVLETKDKYRIACQESEKPIKAYSYSLMPEWADALEFRQFDYNPSFGVEDNATYFANRSQVNGIAKVNIDRVSLPDIYKNATGFSDIPKTGEVRLVVAV